MQHGRVATKDPVTTAYFKAIDFPVIWRGDQLLLGVTVVALSIGVAALPSASLVMMVVILNQIGLPVEYMALIIAVDRLLDMFRTSLNVTSDLVVAKIVDQYEKRDKTIVKGTR